jgi:hypothetical protein
MSTLLKAAKQASVSAMLVSPILAVKSIAVERVYGTILLLFQMALVMPVVTQVGARVLFVQTWTSMVIQIRTCNTSRQTRRILGWTSMTLVHVTV